MCIASRNDGVHVANLSGKQHMRGEKRELQKTLNKPLAKKNSGMKLFILRVGLLYTKRKLVINNRYFVTDYKKKGISEKKYNRVVIDFVSIMHSRRIRDRNKLCQGYRTTL